MIIAGKRLTPFLNKGQMFATDHLSGFLPLQLTVGKDGQIPVHTNTGTHQNQNSLLVKHQNDNTSPGDWPRKISP